MCVIIIGAGPAGCEAAYRLAQAGETVELIEKESETGGNLNNWYQLFPDRKQARDLNQSLRQNIQRPDIHSIWEIIRSKFHGQKIINSPWN